MIQMPHVPLGLIFSRALLLFTISCAFAEDVPITLKTYSELTTRLYALSELELKARLTAAEQLRTDPKQMMHRFAQLREEYGVLRSRVYAAFSTGSSTYRAFHQNNKDAIEHYLSAHPSIAGEHAALRDRIQALADRIEQMLAADRAGTKR